MNIAYILGAGFSKPLGIPVMSEFLEFARRIYDQFPEEYSDFHKIFKLIQRLHSIKEYTELDLTNIEVILSVLEMSRSTRSDIGSTEYEKFIKQVVTFYSPKFPSKSEHMAQIKKDLMSISYNNSIRRTDVFPYHLWLLGILGISTDMLSYKFKFLPKMVNQIDIITLNYDLVLEQLFQDIENLILETSPEEHGEYLARRSKINIIHLHGDVNNEIVPPIWTKTINNSFQDKWRTAADILNKANFIHFLGYSFPQTDGYFRFFLSVSLMDNIKLEKIRVVCLDDTSETVKQRFDNIFAPVMSKKYSFSNENILKYLERHQDCFERIDLPVGDGSFNGVYQPTQELLRRHLTR